MRKLVLLAVAALLTAVGVRTGSADVVDVQFGRGLWATGHVRAVRLTDAGGHPVHVLVFEFPTTKIRGNTGGSRVGLGTSTTQTNLAIALEQAKKTGALIRVHGHFQKVPDNLLAQVPASPSIGLTVDQVDPHGAASQGKKKS
jgi:hypothetical protein